jgi:ribosomal protein L37AE/L43A
MKDKTKTPKCKNPNCRSNFGYFRLTTGEWVCRICGNVYVVEVKK